MSLRRTAIARKSQLARRTPMPRGKLARSARTKTTVGRQKAASTGPTPVQRRVVAERAGYCCELCGARLHDGDAWTAPYSIHHRQPRGAGGTSRPETNEPYNLLLLCGHATSPDGCHAFIESHRTSAEEEGWIVRHGLDPATVPVSLHAHPDQVLLTADGDYQAVTT